MLKVVPLELHHANKFIVDLHRHHKAVQSQIHKFSAGVLDGDGNLRGVVVVGRPVATWKDHRHRLEVLRVCTDGTKNACSILYGAAAKAAQAMGYRYIGTYTRQDEPGTSLRASGWQVHHETGAQTWECSRDSGRSRGQQTEVFPRIYWVKEFPKNPPYGDYPALQHTTWQKKPPPVKVDQMTIGGVS